MTDVLEPDQTIKNPDILTPRVQITHYEVCCLPDDDVNYLAYKIDVEARGRGLWSVLWGGYALSVDGELDYEPSPSNRDDEYLATHRFEEQTALELAKHLSTQLVVNSRSVAEALRVHARRPSTQKGLPSRP